MTHPTRITCTWHLWKLLLPGLALAVLVACQPPLVSTEFLEPGPHSVGFIEVTLEDTQRARSLEVLIWYPGHPEEASYPDAAAMGIDLDQAFAPYPLIIYSHGFSSFKDEGAYLCSQLASRGYVVMSPEFPFTNLFAPGGPDFADVVNQPGDVSFLIDTMLTWNGEQESPFEGGVDPRRIGLTGLSLGGLTTLLATFHPDLRDPRIRAAAPIAAPSDFLGEAFYENARVPLMLLYSDLDAMVDFEGSGVVSAASSRAPRFFVTFFGAAHTAWSSIAALLFESLPNADTVGCTAIGGELPEDPGQVDEGLGDLLGGEEQGIIPGSGRMACTYGAELLPAIRPSRQHELTILSVVPFMDLYLSGRDLERSWEAAEFLHHTLEEENGDELEIDFFSFWDEIRERFTDPSE
jgi:dienelactone hydrolase